jgi:sterol desaturase/sphingolipid hydroxylase (fatty acid hydroxylase superfamily)
MLKWQYISPAIIFATAWIFIGLERLFPFDKGQKFIRKGFFNDFVLYTLVQSFILGFLINAFVHFIDDTSGLSKLQILGRWPLWAQIVFFVVIHDFYIYWAHRAQHRFALLWRTHEAHHSVENVDWLAGSRSHPIEILVHQTVELMPIVLLTGNPDLPLIKSTIDAVWGMYIHSNIDVKSGALQYVINGPELHRWHHSRVYPGHGANYGTKLAIWDYLFGTVHRPPYKPPGYGLDEPFPTNYWRQIVFAFRRFPVPAEAPSLVSAPSQASDAAPAAHPTGS